MKAKVIKYEDGDATVEFTPNVIEKIFGIKPKTKVYRNNGNEYWVDSLKVWFEKDTGKKVGRFEEIDEFIRKSNWN
jgi:tRNA G37 N-methylase Trm5